MIVYMNVCCLSFIYMIGYLQCVWHYIFFEMCVSFNNTWCSYCVCMSMYLQFFLCNDQNLMCIHDCVRIFVGNFDECVWWIDLYFEMCEFSLGMLVFTLYVLCIFNFCLCNDQNLMYNYFYVCEFQYFCL